MLYITTRNADDAFTAHRTLLNDFSPDGGSFVPFRFPTYDIDTLALLKDKSFNQIVSEFLNTFFSLRLTGWDLDFSVGRNLVRATAMNHRIIVAELWHNLGGDLSYIEEIICQKITAVTGNNIAENWPRVAVKISILFGTYGQLLREGMLKPEDSFDFSVNNDDFLTTIAILYCQKMGMPVNTIICTCSEKSNLWDFIHRGTVETENLSPCIQVNIERILHLTLGCNEAVEFSKSCYTKDNYTIPEDLLPEMNAKLFCSVAGKNRSESVINSLYRTNSYLVDTETALCFGGLQDYRAKLGNSQTTVILAQKTPARCLPEIASATGLPVETVATIINQA